MWKDTLKRLEKNKEWDVAIPYMENIIHKKTDLRDAYIAIIFLLMNLLVEEDYNERKHDEYAKKLKTYFKESYSLFLYDPEYLFCVGIIGIMSDWYLDLTYNDCIYMAKSAYLSHPDNRLYQWAYYSSLDLTIPENKKMAQDYAKLIIKLEPTLFEEIYKRGSFGNYIQDCMISWAKKVLNLYPYDTQRF